VTEVYIGRSRYLPDHEVGGETLFVAVACLIGALPNATYALLDTAAQWCLLPPALAELLGYDLTPDPDEPRLSTRYGLLEGRLERIPITFPADEGEPLLVQATFFLSPAWHGPERERR
jgi:hypothetical protein